MVSQIINRCFCLYALYRELYRENHVRPFASRPFTSTAKEEIEIAMGMKLRHDLEGGNGNVSANEQIR
jgi:hypothetical protein